MAEDPRADYGEVSRPLCRTQEEPYCQRRLVPVQEYMPTGIACPCFRC